MSDFENYRAYLQLLAERQLNSELRGRVAASDIVQQTMLEAHRNRNQFRGSTSGERAMWLKQILTRNLADAGKHERAGKRDVNRDFSPSTLDYPGDQSSPSQRAAREEEATRLAAALAQLPETQRESVVLQHWHGMTLAQIGEKLDKSPAAVAGLLKRGLQRLREVLDKK